MGSQIRDTDPGKDEETDVVHDEEKIHAPSGRRPGNELISASDLPGGGSPRQAGDGMPLDIGHVFERRTNDLAIS
jgi:hypothetical protein